MVGILVHGDNHFIVRGRLPDRNVARALIRHWTIIQIGLLVACPIEGRVSGNSGAGTNLRSTPESSATRK
jgi:hypothetical protein